MTKDWFALGEIGQISVTARDIDRAAAFYRDTLGMRFLFRAGDLVFFDCQGVRLMLSVPESAEFDHPASVLYYCVPDIRDAHTSLAGRGVDFRGEPHKIADMGDHELWMAFFDDTEGNTLALMSEVAKAG